MLDRNTLAFVALLIVAQLALWAGVRMLQATFEDPEVAFLFESNGATWIRTPDPNAPSTYGAAGFRAVYRKRFVVDTVPESVVLRFQPFRQVMVTLDGQQLGSTDSNHDHWKREYRFDLAPLLTPGPHELILSVRNRAGPPMVLASSAALGLQTDATWEAMNDETGGWVPAATLDVPQENSVAGKVPTVPAAFLRALPWLSLPFLLGIAWALAYERSAVVRLRTPSASGLRWLLLSAWALLAANNITKVPYHVGFDVNGHFEYILYVLRNGSIPLAKDGWAMFQSPLYHLISTPLYAAFTAMFSSVQVVEALRIVPLFCGAMQVQLCYLATREVFPDRQDLQALGTLLGGLLPMNLYMSQNLGNEPLVGILCSGAIVVALRLQRDPEARWSQRTFAKLGALLGLALLAKLTALLLFVPITAVVVHAAFVRSERAAEAIRASARALATLFAVAAGICGWYYARNWLLLGKPFIGGWDRARGYEWWQEPGYRTFEQFYSFGEALVRPVYSAVYGLWDGFYSTLWLDGFLSSQVEVISFPPWNFDLMLSSAWLSLLPTAALLLGAGVILVRFRRTLGSGELLALVCLGTYFAAMTYLMVRIPSFNTIKATYTMGVLPCYAIVAATGFEPMLRSRAGRAATTGVMAAWALAAYGAYFIV